MVDVVITALVSLTVITCGSLLFAYGFIQGGDDIHESENVEKLRLSCERLALEYDRAPQYTQQREIAKQKYKMARARWLRVAK